MKTILLLCAVVAVALSNPVQQRWNRVHQECQNVPKFYVPDMIFEQLKRGENPALPGNFGQHAHCMLVKLDMVDSNGHIIENGVKQAAQRSISNPNKVNQIVNECCAHQHSKEETALALFGCLGKHNINIGQL